MIDLWFTHTHTTVINLCIFMFKNKDIFFFIMSKFRSYLNFITVFINWIEILKYDERIWFLRHIKIYNITLCVCMCMSVFSDVFAGEMWTLGISDCWLLVVLVLKSRLHWIVCLWSLKRVEMMLLKCCISPDIYKLIITFSDFSHRIMEDVCMSVQIILHYYDLRILYGTRLSIPAKLSLVT